MGRVSNESASPPAQTQPNDVARASTRYVGWMLMEQFEKAEGGVMTWVSSTTDAASQLSRTPSEQNAVAATKIEVDLREMSRPEAAELLTNRQPRRSSALTEYSDAERLAMAPPVMAELCAKRQFAKRSLPRDVWNPTAPPTFAAAEFPTNWDVATVRLPPYMTTAPPPGGDVFSKNFESVMVTSAVRREMAPPPPPTTSKTALRLKIEFSTKPDPTAKSIAPAAVPATLRSKLQLRILTDGVEPVTEIAPPEEISGAVAALRSKVQVSNSTCPAMTATAPPAVLAVLSENTHLKKRTRWEEVPET